MPACARKEIFRQGQSGLFHCWTRCVRRAFLMGNDPLTGQNHDHRQDWVLARLRLLVSCFAIDVGFLAIMSNHLHLVLRVSAQLVDRWSDQEVARRWLRVYPGRRVLDTAWVEPQEDDIEKLAADKQQIQELRERLRNPSWFMSALSEYIARRGNSEDNCSGHFFEARFGLRELLDEASLLICGMYVDLNEIRAAVELTPENSRRCSIGMRLGVLLQTGNPELDAFLAPLTLEAHDLGEIPSTTGQRASDKGLLDLTLSDYARLLDFAGRQIKADKVGAIPADLAPILERLGLVNGERFVEAVKNFPRIFRRVAGKAAQMTARAQAVGRQWMQGIRAARKTFSATPPPAA
jgi:hypothetical protein